MPHNSKWRCLLLLGHRWEWTDSHVYELGRGYELAYDYDECARCGAVRRRDGSVLLSRAPRAVRLARVGRD